MNDDFLSQFRQPPRPEFAHALYEKLAQEAETQQLAGWHSSSKQMALAFAVVCLMLVMTIAVSPAAHAAVDDIIAKIIVRGMTVFVSEETPVFTGESESYNMIWTPVSPDKISTSYSFFAKLPTWVPSGYVLQERAALYYHSMLDETPLFSLFEWKNDNAESIQLSVWKGSCPNGPSSHNPPSSCTLETMVTVGLESQPQVVAVSSQPAVLWRGVGELANLSDPVREWNPSRRSVTEGWALYWENDGRTFELVVTSRAISQGDVIRLAESIP